MLRFILAARRRPRAFRLIPWLLGAALAAPGTAQATDPDAVLARVIELRASDRLADALGEVRALAAANETAPEWFRGDLADLERTLVELAAGGADEREAMLAAQRHGAAYEAANAAGDRAAAADELRAAIALSAEHLGPLHRETLWRRVDLAWTLGVVQDAAGSRAEARAAIDGARDAGLRVHPLSASAQAALAYAELKLGRTDAARAAFDAARAIWAELDPDFPRLRELRAVPVTGLAMLENRLQNHAEADTLFAEAVALTRIAPGEDSVSWANLTNNVGTAFLQRGEPRLAEPFLRRSLAAKLALHPPGHPTVLNSLQNLAVLLLSTGDYASAEELVRTALDGIDGMGGMGGMGASGAAAGVELQIVALLESLAQADIARGNLDLAREHAVRAVEAGRRAFSDQPDKLRASFELLIQVEISRGALDAADALLAELLERVGSPSAGTLAAQSRLALLRGEPEAAEALADEALELLGSAVDPFAAALRAHRGQVAMELGELEQAEELIHAAALMQDEARLKAGPGLARAAFGGTGQWSALAAVRAALGDAEGAWDAAERGRGRVLLELLGPESLATEPFSLARVTAALGDDEALIGWVRGADDVGTAGLWSWSLRADGEPRWTFIAGDPAARIVAFRNALADAASVAYPPEPDAEDAAARALFEVLLAPQLADLAEVRALIAVPAAPVLGVPLEALMDKDGRTVDERFTVSYAPSGSILAWLRERGGARPDANDVHALALGDPPFNEEHRGAPKGDSDARRAAPKDRPVRPGTLPRLVASRGEAEAVATLFPGSTVLVGEAATERALRELDLAAFDVLHFATHALVDDERPERSALVLSQLDLPDPLATALAEGRIDDGLWTGDDIVHGPHLDAEIVALSACDTALGRAVPGEGYLGLADAFLQAGARAVVASLWSVDDRASALFMQRFYAAWRAGASRAEALRTARAALRAHTEGRSHPYAHPGTWAAFVLIGDGR